MSGWSNEIPNPLIIGGGGQSGEIQIFDANGDLIMTLNEEGLITGDGLPLDGSLPTVPYSWLSPTGLILIDEFNVDRGSFWFDSNGDSTISVDNGFITDALLMGDGGSTRIGLFPNPEGTRSDFLVDAADGLQFFPNPGGPGDAGAVFNGDWCIGLGRLAYAEITAASAAFTTIADISGLSITFTVPDGVSRIVELSAYCLVRSSAAGDSISYQIADSANVRQVEGGFTPIPANNASVGRGVSRVRTLAPGSYTFKIRAVRSAGAGSTVVNAAADSPSYIMARDIGGV